MLICLAGGRVIDPAYGEKPTDGAVRDLFMRDGVIIDKPRAEKPDRVIDVRSKIVLAGGIDMHSHIAGGKVNIARMMLPESHRRHPQWAQAPFRCGSGKETMTSFSTGYRYAEMGYTAAFEPAMVAINARQTHHELADVAIIDKGVYVMMGNDEFLLEALQRRAEQSFINDYVAWTVRASGALGVKVVNPGGISAFKFNARRLDLDQPHPHYDAVTPRKILHALTRALVDLGIPHSLHVHGCNLGVAGNAQTTLDTMQGIEGLPMHLTHIQFHAYGDEGSRQFSSAGASIAEAINRHRNITVDVGQILFGQTVTASGDIMRQFAVSHLARPRKWFCMDIECQGACGLVPFTYRDRSFVHALQWIIGLELFLLVEDPWRIFLTTDHPNGAPFTSYPHLIRLLMDRSFRQDMLEKLPKAARQASNLDSITREYSLAEIAIMTRAGPARLLGLRNQGHLRPGARADIAVYSPDDNREAMFSRPDYVFKDGHIVVRQGKVVANHWGCVHRFMPEYDRSIETKLAAWYQDYQGFQLSSMVVGDELEERHRWQVQPLAARDDKRT